jgi:hypothetical protein
MRRRMHVSYEALLGHTPVCHMRRRIMCHVRRRIHVSYEEEDACVI